MVLGVCLAILANPDWDVERQSRRERLDQAIAIVDDLPDLQKGWALFEIGLGEIALGNRELGEKALHSGLDIGISAAYDPSDYAISAKEFGFDDIYKRIVEFLMTAQSTYGPADDISYLAGELAREGHLDAALEIVQSLPPVSYGKDMFRDERRVSAYQWILIGLAQVDNSKGLESIFETAMFEFETSDERAIGNHVSYLSKSLFDAGYEKQARRIITTFEHTWFMSGTIEIVRAAIYTGNDSFAADVIRRRLNELVEEHNSGNWSNSRSFMSCLVEIDDLARRLPPSKAVAELYDDLLSLYRKLEPSIKQERNKFDRIEVSSRIGAVLVFSSTGRDAEALRILYEALELWRNEEPTWLSDAPYDLFKAICATGRIEEIRSLLASDIKEDHQSLGKIAAYVAMNGDLAFANEILGRSEDDEDYEQSLKATATTLYKLEHLELGDRFSARISDDREKYDAESAKAEALTSPDRADRSLALKMMKETKSTSISESLAVHLFIHFWHLRDWKTAAETLPYLWDDSLDFVEAEIAARVGNLNEFERALENIEREPWRCVALARFARYWQD